ncbi:MAG: hypothetical protein ACTSXK_00475 [Promethearchaeota archaeon]
MSQSAELPLKFNQILKSVFLITKKQCEIYNLIRTTKNRGTCINNLVHSLNSERSIIQKQLKILLNKELITRKSVSLSQFQDICRINNLSKLMPKCNKGYLYLYYPISNEDLTEKIGQKLASWQSTLNKILK